MASEIQKNQEQPRKKFRSAIGGYHKADVNAFIEEFNHSYLQMEEYYRAALQDLTSRLEKAEQEKRSLKAAIATARVQTEEALQASEEARLEKQALLAKHSEQEAILKEREEYVTDLQTALDTAKAETRAAKEKAAEAEERMSLVLTEREALQNEISGIKQQCETLRTSLDATVTAATESIEDAQALVHAQTEAMAKAEADLAEKDATLIETQQKLREVSVELEKSRQKEAQAAEILENARKEADEILSKAKNTAQLIKMNALRQNEEASPVTEVSAKEKGSKDKSASVFDAMKQKWDTMRKELQAMYGDTDGSRKD